MPHPEGYRKALRLMKQADKFNRPIICFIDTKGACLDEQRKKEDKAKPLPKTYLRWPASEYLLSASSLVKAEAAEPLVWCRQPLAYAGKLYLFCYFSRGAAALLWKDSSLAKKAAETMKITAPDLKELGIIDHMIKEVKGGAHHDVKLQASYMDETLKQSLKTLLKLSEEELIQQRYEKYKAIGKVSVEDQYIGVN